MLRASRLITLGLAVLVSAPAADAAFTATSSGDSTTLTGSAANEVLVIDQSGGLLRHNRFGDPGFTSDHDFDSTAAGEQTVSSTSPSVVVTTGAGADSVSMKGVIGTFDVDGGGDDDVLAGSPGVDTLRGGAGHDVITGGPGGDNVKGGEGDDRLVWNNGDGADVVDGDVGFDRAEVNGATSGETYTLAAAGDRTLLQREAPGAFSLDIGTVEEILIDARAGDDSVTSSAVTPLWLLGGAGNDTLTGGPANDTIQGGSGGDVLTGGGGADYVAGQEDDDTIAMRDGVADLAIGGAGTDSAVVDLEDVVDGVETVDRTAPPPDPPAPDATATAVTGAPAAVRLTRTKKGYRAAITLTCPAAETGSCLGAATLVVPVRKRKLAVLVQVRRKFALAPGASIKLRFALPRSLRGQNGKRGIKALLRIVNSDAAGNVAEQAPAIRLRPPRR